MRILTYSDLLPNNSASLVKGGLDKSQFIIDFADGVGSGITLTSTSYSAVNSSDVDVSSICVSGVSTSGTQTTVNLLTCGTSGTTAPEDGSRFRVRVLQTLSNSRVLEYDAYLLIDNPGYSPDA